jgi:small subunit ribosomal protein S16
VAVRIRMKRMGRKNRPFYRVVVVDGRAARDGRVLEYLGHYDPLVADTDARAILQGERIDYWLSVGAQPSEKVRVLVKKYGSKGTHLGQQKTALEKLKAPKQFIPPAPKTKPRRPGEEQETETTAGEPAEAPAMEAASQES